LIKTLNPNSIFPIGGPGLRTCRKWGYISGDLGISIAYFVVGFFFMYYLTDLIGLDPKLAGIAFGIGMFWDAITDPMMGFLSDLTRSKRGRKRIYVLFGAAPLGFSFFLLWTIPSAASETVQFILATLMLLLFKTAYTVVAVPYMSLLPVISSGYDERTQISGMRAFTSQFGTILGGVSALMVSSFSSEIAGLRTLGISYGVLVTILMIVSAQSVKGLEIEPSRKKRVEVGSLSKILERNFLVLIVLYFFGGIATTSMTASFPYFAEHIMGDEGLSTFGLAAFILTAMAFIPLWLKLAKRFHKKYLLLISTTATASILAAMGFLLNDGMVAAFFILVSICGAFMSAYFIIPYSLVPDTVDLSEIRTGERNESIFFGIWVFIHKLGLAAAPVIMGFMMGGLGYDGDLEVQTSMGLLSVRLTFAIMPAFFFVLTGMTGIMYGISRDDHIEMEKSLKEKRRYYH
jgi:GPH family glycoside/pentoside/hexuronide:cation symporter